jgi:hypothetical protein
MRVHRTVIEALALWWRLSSTVAVMVCVPEESVVSERLSPVPIGPSRVELQWMLVARLPSSVSEAVAVKATAAPGTNLEPLAGPVIASVGAASTMTVMDETASVKYVSCAVAVRVWLPEERVDSVMLPPRPSVGDSLGPHDGARDVEVLGVDALAVKVIGLPGANGPLVARRADRERGQRFTIDADAGRRRLAAGIGDAWP